MARLSILLKLTLLVNVEPDPRSLAPESVLSTFLLNCLKGISWAITEQIHVQYLAQHLAQRKC